MGVFVALCVLTFLLAMVGDWVETKWVLSVSEGNGHRAALCSIGMWAIGAIGFIAVLEVSLWLMVPEVFGLYAGSILALRKR